VINYMADTSVLIGTIPVKVKDLGDTTYCSSTAVVLPISAGDNNIGNVDIVTLPSSNLGQQLKTASLSVVPATDIIDATYIGDVRFGESLPAGTANIGDVDVLTIPALVAGSAIIGKVGIDQTAGQNGVVVNSSALPTGASTSANQATLIAKDFATQTTLAALLAKVITAPSTEAKQDTLIAKDFATQTTLAAILAKIIAAPATEATLSSIAGYVDGIEALLTATNVEGTALASAARTVTVSSADIINNHGKGIHIILDVTAVATSDVKVKVEGKDLASGKYYTILESASVTTVSTNVYKVYPGLTAAANLIASDILPKTIRLTATHANANSTTYSVGYNLV
jgi:hypothetical protein